MKKFSEMKSKKIDIEKIRNDTNKLLEQFNNAESFKEQDGVFAKINKYMDDVATNTTLIGIRYTIDTQDKQNKKLHDQLDEVLPYIEAIYNDISKAVLATKFKDEFINKYGNHLFVLMQNSMECFSDVIIEDMQEENKLVSEYTQIVSTAKIEIEGEVYDMESAFKYVEELDREKRKSAALAIAKFYEDNDAKLGDIYDKLVKVRTRMAKKLGYNNYVELGYKLLGRVDYTYKDIEKYRQQIVTDIVPLTNKLRKDQIKRLKIKNPQYYDYTISFLSGNPAPKGNKDFMIENAKKMYKELSNDTDVFFNFMNDNELMDLEAKPGKVGGGYMTYLPKYKAPFIFSNFNGTSGDVDVLTHEFGHAFQGYLSRNIAVPSYRGPGMETCEMHSMSMEYITYPWMDLFFGEDGDKYRYYHLVEGLNFIPYGALIDEFQHFAYLNPEATHEERCAAYLEMEKKYLPHKKYDDCEIYRKGRFWMNKHHIFDCPLYYIDYTIASIVAFQFFNEDRKNHDKAWKKYVKLCKLGGKYPYHELMEKAHLMNPFDDGVVAKSINPLKKYLKQFDDSKF